MPQVEEAHRRLTRYVRGIEHPSVYSVEIAPAVIPLGFALLLKTDMPWDERKGLDTVQIAWDVEQLLTPFLGRAGKSCAWHHEIVRFADVALEKHIYEYGHLGEADAPLPG